MRQIVKRGIDPVALKVESILVLGSWREEKIVQIRIEKGNALIIDY